MGVIWKSKGLKKMPIVTTKVDKKEKTRCGVCNARKGMPHHITGEFVQLTVVEVDTGKVKLCQRCHKFYLDSQKQKGIMNGV